MITYYTYDAQGVFIGAVDRTKYEAIPKPCTTTKPPSLTGTEVARWNGSVWEVLAERPPLPEPDPETLAAEARATRNALLAASDWTQVADAPVDQAAWAKYRQALRDITAQEGFPETIDWPVAPE